MNNLLELRIQIYLYFIVDKPWMFSNFPGTEKVFVLNSLIHLLLLSSDLMYSICCPCQKGQEMKSSQTMEKHTGTQYILVYSMYGIDNDHMCTVGFRVPRVR